jgi:hypothetical protein
MSTPFEASQLPLAPLGAGDLIDRAVRLYRQHLTTLMRIAAPPVVLIALGSVTWTVSTRRFFSAAETSSMLLYGVLAAVGAAVMASGYIFNLIVMGGAARNVVAHLLWGEPVSAYATYSAVRSRFWKLLWATLLVAAWGLLSFSVAFIALYFVMVIIGVGAALLGFISPYLTLIVIIIAFIVGAVVSLWLLFFMLGRVAYVPQVLLVEGKGVFDSVARSFSLARGNVRRLMAMTLFITFATYSALMILIVPLGWFGYVQGVDPSPWNAASWPSWYAVGYSVLEPLSSILLTPIWMLGLSLLYVDERVRHEGYDIELLASQRLPPVPEMGVSSPFGPAISVDPRTLPPPPLAASGKVLGLS